LFDGFGDGAGQAAQADPGDFAGLVEFRGEGGYLGPGGVRQMSDQLG
jgi:hypothetical protein